LTVNPENVRSEVVALVKMQCLDDSNIHRAMIRERKQNGPALK
jgi:hypothetical protein